MSTPRAIDIVARVSCVLAQLRASDDPDANWLAESLALWLAGAPFDGALGLDGGWRDVIHHRQQQAALAGLLGGLPAMSTRAAAVTIAEMLKRYETTGWKRDSAAGHRPSGRPGHLWDYLSAGGSTSVERLRKRLAWVTETIQVTQTAA